MRLNDPRRPMVAFAPPSDMVGDGGSSRTKKVFVGLGIGCGVILIICGILFAAGAFKAVSCCNDIKNIADNSVGAQEFGVEFARQVYAGELDAAYTKTSAQFQDTKDLATFKSAVGVHKERMQSNKPRLINMQLEQHDVNNPSLEQLKDATWMLSYQFAEPNDTTMLLLNLRVGPAPAGDEEVKYEVRDVVFDERPRNLQMEPPAEEVFKIHDGIQRGHYEMVYAQLGDEFRTGTDRETWRGFLNDAGPILTSSEIEVRQVSYNDDNTQATVIAHATTHTGKNGIIQYELKPERPEVPGFGWKIVTIAPLVAEAVDAPLDVVPSTNNGTNGSADAADMGDTATTK